MNSDFSFVNEVKWKRAVFFPLFLGATSGGTSGASLRRERGKGAPSSAHLRLYQLLLPERLCWPRFYANGVGVGGARF